MADKAFLQTELQRLTDQGKIIEAGWIGLRIAVVPADAGAVQLDEMRKAFFAGAQHLFSSIMTILEPDADPTEKDLERMDLIDQELKSFIEKFELKHFPAKGRS